MAGRPIYRKAVALIKQSGGEEWVMEQFMNGELLSNVASILDISRGMLYEWLHKDKERWRLYGEARRVGTHAMVEEAVDILEHSTSDTIAVDRERARIRQWIAERVNRQDFGGEKAQIAGTVLNIQELHLTALQAADPVPQLPQPEIVIEEKDVEVLL